MIYYFITCFVLLGVFEIGYFRIAKKYNIIDRPNARSSHSTVTIRGGGVVFPVSIVIWYLLGAIFYWPEPVGAATPVFVLGLLLIATISFLDDMITLSSNLRLFIQCCSIGLLIYQLHFSTAWIILPAFILVTGFINGYNFMDGINGITALYSIIVVGTFFWIDQAVTDILPDAWFICILAGLLVFAICNVRKKALCFAGDVGSISIAYIISFICIKLVLTTQILVWVLLVGIYGIDIVCTILFRISRKEKILQAHRSHFYQYLANETAMNHLQVSSLYAGIQLLLNYVVIRSILADSPAIAWAGFIVILIIYVIFRFRLEGKYRLLTKY